MYAATPSAPAAHRRSIHMDQTFFRATAKAAKAKNDPPPNATKMRSAMGLTLQLGRTGRGVILRRVTSPSGIGGRA